MNQNEQAPKSEATSGQVYSKAREILDLHGHSGAKPTLLIIPRPGGLPRNTLGTDIPITEAPVVSIQIAEREYRLRLTSRDDRQDKHDETLELTIHFQQLPYGLDNVEYDEAGHVIGYWYRHANEPELKHVGVVRAGFLRLPKELEFSWYQAKCYSLTQGGISKIMPAWKKNVPPEIAEGLKDTNEFIFEILDKMQTELNGKSA